MELFEAFKALDALNEDTFSVSDDGIEKLDAFQSNDESEEFIDVIDTDAETPEDFEDSYVGKVILDCTVCHSKVYKDKEDVELNDDETLANVGEDCPFCFTSDGFKIIGEVANFNSSEKEESSDDIEVKEIDVEEKEDSNLDEELHESYKDTHMIMGGDGSEVYTDEDLRKIWDDSHTSDPSMKEYKSFGDWKSDTISQMEELNESKSINEDINNLSLDTNDTHMEMTSDDEGKVTITTEPIEKEAPTEEVLAPVSDDTKAEIINKDEGEEIDVEIDEFDEESFDELGERYLKEAYNNVESFKTTSVAADNNMLKIEGVVKFNSGNEKTTSFVFESKYCTKDGTHKFLGENVNLTKGKKAFSLTGKVIDKKFISESLRYDYNDRKGASARRYGIVRRG